MKKAIVYFLFSLILFCFIQQNLNAVPAYPDPVIFTQPDGKQIEITLKGDEKVKWAITKDGYTVLFNKKGFLEYAKQNSGGDLVPSGITAVNPEKRSKEEVEFLAAKKKGLTYSVKQVSTLNKVWETKNLINQKAFPKTGSQKLICILIGFTDLSFSLSQTEFHDLFNQTGYSVDGATGSVKDYYSEVSYGQLNLSVDVAGPYTASLDMASYGENNSTGDDINPRALITEALTLADKDVNFADYDNDHDGYADGVYIIYAGYGEEAGASENAIWAHAWSISPVILDGVSISRYSCSSELRRNTGLNITRIGVICHEFGHVLGAPDFYDTDYSGSDGSFKGTGKWDIMASGSWNNGGATPAHHNAYTKAYIFNWGKSNLLNSATNVVIQNSAFHSEEFYQFNTTTSGEFYLMENRNKVGFDAGIPGEGLIIYHVHSDMINGGNMINTGNPQKMYPVCANAGMNPATSPSSYGEINSSSCPFPGTDNMNLFTDNTFPGSKSWLGDNTDQPLTNIVFHSDDKSITFDFMGGESGDQGEDCSNAIILAGETGSKNSSTTGFKNDYSGSCETDGNDRVYYLSTPVKAGGTVEIWTNAGDFNASLYARYGNCTGIEIACTESEGEKIHWENTTGAEQNIWIFIDGYDGMEGNTNLNWQIIQPVTQGENCDDPFIISGISGNVSYSTTGYTNDYSSEGCDGTGEDVVFYLETPVPVGGTIEFSTSDDNYDVVLYGRYGSCSGTQIACSDDPDGTILRWENDTDTEQYIWIIADGYGKSDGKATLNWEIYESRKLGENCNNPIYIIGNSGNVEFSTSGYTDDFHSNCATSGGDIVYYLETPVPYGSTLELWTTGEDNNVSIYGKYESCDGTEIGCSTEKSQSIFSWKNLTGNNQGVWIIADGFGEGTGTAVLHWNINQIFTGLEENKLTSSVTLYPNPVSDQITIKVNKENLNIEKVMVYGILGNLAGGLQPGNFSDELNIDVSGYAKGTYIVEVHFNDEVVRKKIEVIR